MSSRSSTTAYVAHLSDSAPVVRRLTRDILRAQRKLRREVGDGAWRTYLRLEALVNHRHDEILRKVHEHGARGSRTER